MKKTDFAYRMMLLASLAAGTVEAGVTISMPKSPQPWERTAAAELTNYLSQVSRSGAVRMAGADGVVFHVGDTDFARRKGLGAADLQDEAWVVKSWGGDVVLAGGGMHGTLYAVSHFLEDVCGVRWWMDGEEDVPASESLELPAVDLHGKPFFACRDIYRGQPSADFRTAIRNRLNGNGDTPVPPEWGGSFRYGRPSHIHTWDRYLPFERYGKDHPEWYALVDGRRVGGNLYGQMCLTCPGLDEAFARRAEDFIRQDEEDSARKGLPPPRVYDLSMNDNEKYCTCTNCRLATARLGHAGLQLDFVRRIADRLSPKHPGLSYSMAAYHYSEPAPPPGVLAPSNVIVKLCNTRQNMSAGIFDPDNRFFHDLIVDWRKRAGNLFVWEYAVIFGRNVKGFPLPGEFAIPEKYRFYADMGVSGFLIEHEFADIADMYALRFFLECRMLEDPYQDGAALVTRFFREYYGAAGREVLAVRRRLDELRRSASAKVSWTPSFGDFDFLPDAELACALSAFDRALSAVRGDARRERRVARARLNFERLAESRRATGVLHPPEPGVSETPFYDFPADDRFFMFYRHRDDISIVPDMELGPAEKTVRLRVKDDTTRHDLPFKMGFYDLGAKKTLKDVSFGTPLGPGYRWYDLGEVVIPSGPCYTFLTRQWSVTMPMTGPGMVGRRVRVRALVRFSGSKFFPESTERNEIRIARVVYSVMEGEKGK